MKVIEDNYSSAQFVFPFRKTCNNCHSELEVEDGDLQRKEGKNQFEATYHYYVVACPLCKHVMMVEPKRR